MFLGCTAWIALRVLGTCGVITAERPSAFMAPDAGLAVLILVLIMWFAPKIATVIDALTRPKARYRYGGGPMFLVNVAVETIFFLMLSPIMWFAHTVFLATLVFGGSVGWGGQARDDHAVPLRLALAKLWPQTALGWACLAALAVAAPVAIPYALLIAGGLAFAVPLCVVTANRAVGMALPRAGIGRLPEETTPSPLDALAVEMMGRIKLIRGVKRSGEMRENRMTGTDRSNEGKACDAILQNIEAREGGMRRDLIFPEKTHHVGPVELVCTIGEQRFAFEHTRIEPFAGHIRLEAEARRHFQPITDMLSGEL